MFGQDKNLLLWGNEVFDIEIEALKVLKQRLGDSFIQACTYLWQCSGRIILLGLGKSGHIARKIAATFASTGSPAFFVHAAEANHGDAGMITRGDVLMVLSHSGETLEMINLLPLFKRLDLPIICLSGAPHSTLAQAATVYIDTSVGQEACPLGLAPTSSTTNALVMGDALAITLLHARGFTATDFAYRHPGGQLGKRLLLKVSDIMRVGNEMPRVQPEAMLNEALMEMTEKKLGFTAIVDAENHLMGVYSDGDLRRTLNRGVDIYSTCILEVFSDSPKIIAPECLAAEAFYLLEEHKITVLCVVSDQNHLIGVVHIYDLLKAGLG